MNQIIGINHLKQVCMLLEKCKNLLSPGEEIYPYNKIIDNILAAEELLKDEIEQEESILGI